MIFSIEGMCGRPQVNFFQVANPVDTVRILKVTFDSLPTEYEPLKAGNEHSYSDALVPRKVFVMHWEGRTSS